MPAGYGQRVARIVAMEDSGLTAMSLLHIAKPGWRNTALIRFPKAYACSTGVTIHPASVPIISGSARRQTTAATWWRRDGIPLARRRSVLRGIRMMMRTPMLILVVCATVVPVAGYVRWLPITEAGW